MSRHGNSPGVRAASPRRTPTFPAYVQAPTKPGDRERAGLPRRGQRALGPAPGTVAAATRACAPAPPGSGVAVIGYRG